jgi:hypothetical protein
MVLSWYAYGTQLLMVRLRYASGTLAVRIWYAVCTRLVRGWYAAGTRTAYRILIPVPDAYQLGTRLVRVEQFADEYLEVLGSQSILADWYGLGIFSGLVSEVGKDGG